MPTARFNSCKVFKLGLKLKIHLKRISQTWRWKKMAKIKHLFGNVADETT